MSSIFVFLEQVVEASNGKWDGGHVGLGSSAGVLAVGQTVEKALIPLFKFLTNKYPVIKKVLSFLCKNALTEEECGHKSKKVRKSKN